MPVLISKIRFLTDTDPVERGSPVGRSLDRGSLDRGSADSRSADSRSADTGRATAVAVAEDSPVILAPAARPQRTAGSKPSSPPARSSRIRWQTIWPWLVLWPWSVAWTLWDARRAGQSWHFFATGANVLFSAGHSGGLHLYATHPQLQIGPLAFVVAALLGGFGHWPSEIPALVAMSATGPPLLAAVWRLLPAPERGHRVRLVLAGLVFLPVWAEVTTGFAHLDDLLALCLSVAALHAVRRERPVLAALALAGATDAKPWAAAMAVVLLALPGSRRWLGLGVFAVAVAAAWLPFLIADPHSIAAARFTIPNDPSSALRALGVSAARTPAWDRPAQLALGAAAGWLAVRRGRWQAVVLLVIATRMLLDPGVYPYYTSGLLLGTVVVDLVLTRWRVPWFSVAAAALLYAARFTGELAPLTMADLGALRASFTVAVTALLLTMPGWWLIHRAGRHRHA